MKNETLILLIILLPLIGFALNGIMGNKLPKSIVGIIGSGAVLGSFILTCILFNQVANTGAIEYSLFQWISIGNMQIEFSFLVDQLSVWMMTIITGIGFLIHVYSIGYMHDDEGFSRFFAYLNLFIFSMLLLVMGSNYLILFIGWEGVGLCSYLLIGFWYKNVAYGHAARKAFIMNRIGDLGLLLGIFLMFDTFGTIQYKEVFEFASSGSYSTERLTLITLLLFVGAMGKSAQIPLYTWLPDAMAGPTPVSALIHAATMVTAGIYLIVRSKVLYTLSPTTLDVVLYVGLATSLFAAFIGLRQNDIKKVLAYSTVSQLGLMFVALGVGAYSSGMFHVTTHAFFKALLFLGAGSVIHAMSGEQDIRKMGGLKGTLKITHITFLIGTLAIIGFPLFSGFFSKDEILAKVFEHSPILWAVALFSSFITGVYMLRMYFVTFWGSFRGTEDQKHHLHESPISMTFPLMVLAVLSLVGGIINLPHLMGHSVSEKLHHWLSQIKDVAVEHHAALSVDMELMLMGIAIVMVLCTLVACYIIYNKKENLPVEDYKQNSLASFIGNKFYVDELYHRIFVRPTEIASNLFYKIIDVSIIDGIVNGIGNIAVNVSKVIRFIQNGNIEFYFLAMVLAIVVILSRFIF
ncbi:MAG: NADH-quinone oxidoreductase subunit L [Bacteroidetes bacterium]|nr:NADH-quinone oxidoreductase subunit L [Bacteroidota bacterium]